MLSERKSRISKMFVSSLLILTLLSMSLNIVFASEGIGIDIKPGSCPNGVNVMRSNGKLPVAILGTESLDVTMVDLDTVMLGFYGDTTFFAVEEVKAAFEDVDGDGYLDLIMQFKMADIRDAYEDFIAAYPLFEGDPYILMTLECEIDSADFMGTDWIKIPGL